MKHSPYISLAAMLVFAYCYSLPVIAGVRDQVLLLDDLREGV